MNRAWGSIIRSLRFCSATPDPCLLVFDGIEKYSARALGLAARLIQDLLAGDEARHPLLFTAQFDAADRIIRRLVELDVPLRLLEAVTISRPSETEVRGLVAAVPEIQWASLRPELRPLLTNLKVLDWVSCAAVRGGHAINDRALSRGLRRSSMCYGSAGSRAIRIAQPLASPDAARDLEGDTLLASVQRMQLSQSEQAALGSLTASDLVRIRDQRVRFTHDMLGDWARLNVLIGEPGLSAPTAARAQASRRWHRPMRLFGQRLLEQAEDGPERWRKRSIAQSRRWTEEGAIIRDQLVEALFLATNAVPLLQRSWDALVANGGRLLKLMLERFMFAATLPDPRIGTAVIDGGEGRVGTSLPTAVLALLGSDADRAPRSS